MYRQVLDDGIKKQARGVVIRPDMYYIYVFGIKTRPT